ncbi:MAG: DEAD/DEAH box helicase [Cyanophyceae cyanobacterium]
MDFLVYEPFNNNEAQKKVWGWLQDAFKDEAGIAYYRYPIFAAGINREPDILMLHRQLGVWVIDCQEYAIDSIATIEGDEWQMNDWQRETETPVVQAEDKLFAVQSKLTGRRETRGLLDSLHFRVALPHIERHQWETRGFHQRPATHRCDVPVILVSEDLTPEALRRKLIEASGDRQQELSDREWELIAGVFGGTLPASPRHIPTGTPLNHPARVIQAIESQLKILDETQQQIAFEVPDGPQRLRGLAGTGKTVLLAKRAAKIHASHPDWTIALVFFTRSLYDQILKLIAHFYREMTSEEPDWTKLRVLHAWGGREQPGFYYSLAMKCGHTPQTVGDVTSAIGPVSPGKAFESICQRLEESPVPAIYDAVLIDEGQDLPPVFYRLAYKTLKEPRRLYWAYDEAQGIGSLMIPTSETLFGRNADGSLGVDVRGSYEGGILKSHILNQCYRSPRSLLMAAHAVNMGLFRRGGALQGVTNQKDWQDLGYAVTDGDFKSESVKAGRTVTVTRSLSASPHPVDREDFDLKDALGTLLTIHPVWTEREEREWIAKQVAQDLAQGLDPWDIMITALAGDYEKDYLYELQNALKEQGIDSYIAGVNGDRSIFRKAGHVTIANVYRAKGNEAWKVYACRFHYATQPLEWKQENELHKRNEAFVALTRSRVWCVVTGIDSPIFAELQQALEQYPHFTFPAFNRASLKRHMEEAEPDS